MASLTTTITSTTAATAAASVEPAALAAPATAASDVAAPGFALGVSAHPDTPMSSMSRRLGHVAAARLTRAADQVLRIPALSLEGSNG
jgi:hypothetical protein